MSCGLHLDMSMNIMEETRFKKKHKDLIEKLAKDKNIHFTYNEIEAILLIYYRIQKDGKDKRRGISKSQFQEFLHYSLDMTDTELTSVMLMAYFRGPNITVPMDMWVKALSLLLRGTLEEKIKHCYSVYDSMGTYGKIGRDTMLFFLANSLLGQSPDDDTEDAVKDMIEVLTKIMDWDRDGKISFEDFRKTCLNQPLLIEALGQCLPSRLAAHAFLTSFTHKVEKL